MRVKAVIQIVVAAVLVCALCPVLVVLFWLPLERLSFVLGFEVVPFSCDALFSFFGVVATISASAIVAKKEFEARNEEKRNAARLIEEERERCKPAFELRCRIVDGGIVVTFLNASEFDFYCLEYCDGLNRYLVKGKISSDSEFEFAVGAADEVAPYIDDECPIFPEGMIDRKNQDFSLLLFCQDKYRRLWALEYWISPDENVLCVEPELLPS